MTPLLLLPLFVASMQSAPAAAQRGWIPTSKWIARFDEDRCAAIREYRRGGETLRLNFETSPLHRKWSVKIEAPGDIRREVTKGGGAIRIDGEKVPGVTVSTWFSARPKHILHWSKVEGGAFDKLRKGTRLHLAAGAFSYQLPLADMPQLARTLDSCDVACWRVSASRKSNRRGSRPLPLPPLSVSISPGADYPKSAMMRGSSGETSVIAMVGADGTVNAAES